MENEKAKSHAQQKYIRKNYVRFPIDMNPDIMERFKELCRQNGTTPTTEVKKFINDYISANSK